MKNEKTVAQITEAVESTKIEEVKETAAEVIEQPAAVETAVSETVTDDIAAPDSKTVLGVACDIALTAYKAIKNDKDAKASDLDAAMTAMNKALEAYNGKVLSDVYTSFRISGNPFVSFFTAGTWDKRRYSAKANAFETVKERLDVLDFIAISEKNGTPVCNNSRFMVAMDTLISQIRQRVTDELSQAEDIHVSYGAITKSLQAVMDVIAVPGFEINGQAVKIYARPKDARFLCACATRASKKIGGVQVAKTSKIAPYLTDVYFVQVNHEDYKVE